MNQAYQELLLPHNPLDLRSDTLTKPSQGMRVAMAEAEVGDDVFGEDPTVNRLQAYAAELMGMEAGLFVPSGTMGNQLAMMAHCQRGDEVIVGWGAHSYLYEGGGASVLAGVQIQVLGSNGYFSPNELEAAIHPYDLSGHCAPTTLMMIENTHNRGGGKWMSPEDLEALVHVARQAQIATHIDGARLWNAAIAAKRAPSDWGRQVDSLTFCLSKGLGAPVGSILCGNRAFIKKAHRYRKMLGGGMRQAGILAAAGLYALENQVTDLAQDHQKALRLAHALSECKNVKVDLSSVHTNILLFEPIHVSPTQACQDLNPHVKVLPFGVGKIRAVLHRDVDEEAFEGALKALCAYFD